MSSKFCIVKTKQYRRDFKKITRSGQYDIRKLDMVVNMLARGEKLPTEFRNHHLQGDMQGWEECHIAYDWLLVYLKRKDVLMIVLMRTGSHSDIFGD